MLFHKIGTIISTYKRHKEVKKHLEKQGNLALEQNEAGQRLIEFCQENALVIANTLFQ